MTNELFNLDGKLAVVTGASRGIGLAMAIALAEAGADIVGVSAHMPDTGGDVRLAVEGLNHTFTGIRADFADQEQVLGVAHTLQSLGRTVEVLVNNAGTIIRAPAESFSDTDWQQVLQVNLNSQFTLTREVAKGMLDQGSGKIIFTASLLSFQGGITVPAYTASKSAIAGLTKALSNEWAARGLNVNAIAPGYIETDNTQALQDDRERRGAITGRIPAGRWGTPQDLAGATVFLASRASDYVNGIVLPVDGGWLGR